jgi:DNA-binding SARP family transcriptional activator
MLRLFGPLTIEGTDGTGLGQRPTRGLIAYLALKHGPASTDELLEALWPRQAPSKTRSRFWKAKRQAHLLLGDALERTSRGYHLNPAHLQTDVEIVERIHQQREDADLSTLEDAVALIAGEPLSDIDYPWADGERRRLQALAIQLLQDAATARLAAGDPAAALQAAEQLIALDHLDEHAWRLAMRCEAALSQRQAVISRYQHLSNELDQRLGLKPATETRDTYRQLLGQK